MYETQRLQKFMAASGIASRRACEKLIVEGRVTVDGQVVTELGFKIDPHSQTVALDGRKIKMPKRFTYVMLNKPSGFVTTLSDELGRPTVLELVPVRASVKPVGRLDVNTEGLLLLTDDGEMINRLTHPKYEVSKTYKVTAKGAMFDETVKSLEKGLFVDGKKTAPARVNIKAKNLERTILEITIKEGRKRQVRLMMATVGHPVKSLKRTRFGPLSLTGVKRGSYRFLTNDEVAKLKRLLQS